MLMGVIDAAEEAEITGYYFFWHRFCRQLPHLRRFLSHDGINGTKATVPVITHWDHGRSMEDYS